ncbi:hypothetical protein GE21DRAFT_6645 [Neurospora crassa]|uniref:DASH complex subunit ASK1 n=1 Tax=Neurospora crassa (strain ATCC 24698 / 74-OR23-1A / CBS 708.71 / DSM 1257 / FGSC 987) TaxID=367110 RepID=Q7S8K5_NEUCR|nr:hypothetical protein NCU05280 [Neurospora crassa OR74A]EAA32681.2 hypothetical protein NCU05280 [Neurospora crassa OR74A]KHE84966.1 hypothetical protein GE21DRAFT_6645 [Neurospora crassa]|eukprot:XP_961917.2 hypothetical protein NCU05280 [Neurospora crassa OR74A]
MSVPGTSSTRPLTLTEELEKLEQSITLTLQEIDSNFSRAHRIVTTNILPLVEQYGEHSKSVWESTKFWKQFFEASANVSLSGYEELANGNETTVLNSNEESTSAHDQTTPAGTPHPQSAGRSHDITIDDESSATFNAQGQNQVRQRTTNDSVLTDTGDDLSGSTPRPPATKSIPSRPQFANLDSPYEQLRRRELKAAAEASKTPGFGSGSGGDTMEDDDSELIFQQHTARLPDMSMTPHRAQNTPFGEQQQQRGGTANKDPILHRMPDRNYRVGATPHKGHQASGVSPIKWKVTEKKPPLIDPKGKGKAREEKPLWQDSFMSSPEMEVPQLRSAAFMSPIRSAYRGNTRAAAAAYAARSAPRTPGVSVQTPLAGRKTKDVFSANAANAHTNAGKTPIPKGTVEAKKRYLEEIDWESDSEQDPFGGMSPPKTIQFALPPSKLLQTPAREASKKIVENLLLTAGEMPEGESEFSPSVVKMNPDLMDETF